MAIEKEISVKFNKDRILNKYLIHMCIIYLYNELKFNLEILNFKFNWKKIGQDGCGPRRFFNLGRCKRKIIHTYSSICTYTKRMNKFFPNEII